ncbi:MAG: hypothetical protein R3C02_23705 [Planctomycetaceae bacterium]
MNRLSDSILQNTHHLWGRCNSEATAEIAANDICGLLNPNAIHSVEYRERQEIIGYEEIPKTSKTKRKGGKGVTTGVRHQPVYGKKLEEYVRYLTPQEQQIQLKQLVMNQRVGEFFFKGETILWLSLPLFTDMCSDEEARQTYARMRMHAPYTEPLDLRKHWIGSNKPKTEMAAQPSGKPAMRRSNKRRKNTR